MNADELIQRIENKRELDEEWLILREEVQQFLNGDYPEEEKKKFKPLGTLEILTMMCDGLERGK